MNGSQLNLYDMAWEQFKITKPIRLIEFFAGYGSQALALKYLGVPFEHWKTCEWAIKSIQAYKDIHFTNTQYWKDTEDCTIPKEMLQELLYKAGISQNYNEPMTLEQIKRLSHEQLLRIYENIMITNNLVNIQRVKGKDLEIEDTDKYDYILTYSFPCQMPLEVMKRIIGILPENALIIDPFMGTGTKEQIKKVKDLIVELGVEYE